MIEVSRRSFLIGSAAIVAATQLPPPVAEPAIVPVRALAGWRKVWSIAAGSDDYLRHTNERGSPIDRVLEYSIHRGQAEDPVMRWAMPSRATVLWSARPGDEVFVDEDYAPLVFKVGPADANLELHLCSTARDGRGYFERYCWENGKLVQTESWPLDAEREPWPNDEPEKVLPRMFERTRRWLGLTA